MNAFFIAAAVLVASLTVPLLLIGRGRLIDALIAFELVGVTVTAVLLLLAAGDADSALADPALADPALVLAFLAFGGGLVYVHYAEGRM